LNKIQEQHVEIEENRTNFDNRKHRKDRGARKKTKFYEFFFFIRTLIWRKAECVFFFWL